MVCRKRYTVELGAFGQCTCEQLLKINDHVIQTCLSEVLLLLFELGAILEVDSSGDGEKQLRHVLGGSFDIVDAVYLVQALVSAIKSENGALQWKIIRAYDEKDLHSKSELWRLPVRDIISEPVAQKAHELIETAREFVQMISQLDNTYGKVDELGARALQEKDLCSKIKKYSPSALKVVQDPESFVDAIIKLSQPQPFDRPRRRL